jgi:hypothetical protein
MLEAEKVTRDSAGPLLQYRLDTRHTLTEAYWQAILDFADLYMTGK